MAWFTASGRATLYSYVINHRPAPGFFSQQWAGAVRDALAAGPSGQARAGKLPEYWDFFELIKGMYPASWALGCRDLPVHLRGGPAYLGAGPAYLFVQRGGGTVTDCRIIAPDAPPEATYVLAMDYLDWKALHEGYDAQRTVMYRKMMLEDGNLLEFFKGIHFFVPRRHRRRASRLPGTGRALGPGRPKGVSPPGRAAGRRPAPPARPAQPPATVRCRRAG